MYWWLKLALLGEHSPYSWALVGDASFFPQALPICGGALKCQGSSGMTRK